MDAKLRDGSDATLLRLLGAVRMLDRRLTCFTGYEGYPGDIERMVDGLRGEAPRSPHLNLLKAVLGLRSMRAKYMFSRNVIYNAGFRGNVRRRRFEERHGFKSPTFLVISPTTSCNLRCRGCYAARYEKHGCLDADLVDRIITEGKAIGTYACVLSGGEVFTWPHFLSVVRRHRDVYFLIYTNGTLIDEGAADTLAELGNVALALSVEGLQPETDARRGEGVYQRVSDAMERLKKRGLFFGYSTMVTGRNAELVAGDEFVDHYYAKGCRFGWYFQFLPIGDDPDVRMMATPQQRDHLRRRISEIRDRRRDFSIGDFWNDGCLMGGCIAAGRHYVHINAHGDVEPCAFVHFAVDNIKGKSLEQVLKSDFLAAIRDRQPYSPNLYAPCMIIDNPHVLREVVATANPRPTHAGAECVVKDPQITDHIDEYSRAVHALTDGLEVPFRDE